MIKNDLLTNYAKARMALQRCLMRDENQFLDAELTFPIDRIVVENDCVIMQFFGTDSDSFIIETRLKVVSPEGNQFGYYAYQEDENGNFLDDFLVFE